MKLTPFLTQSFDSPKSALIAIVNQFENNPELYQLDKVLEMSHWEECIIGMLNQNRCWVDFEEHILTNFLGLDLNCKYNDGYAYFKSDQNYWPDDEWKYFKFFTGAVALEFDTYYLSDWIAEVKEVLKNES